MKDDPFGKGIIAGLVGVLAINLVEVLLTLIKLSETPLWQAGGIVFLTEAALQTPLGIAIGIFSHIFIAVALGVIIAYYITYSGSELAVYKGAGISLIAGFIVLTIIFPLRGLAKDMQGSPGDVLSALIDHAVFGALAGYIIKHFLSNNEKEKSRPENKINHLSVSLKPHTKPHIKKQIIFKKPKKI